MSVKPKKHFGQHFLTDKNIASKTADLIERFSTKNILEIGPGMGMLTQFLLNKKDYHVKVVEIDPESVSYLQQNYQDLEVMSNDFLKMDLSDVFDRNEFAIIGNFPYNISSQIVFKAIENLIEASQEPVAYQELKELMAAPPFGIKEGLMPLIFMAFYFARENNIALYEDNIFRPYMDVEAIERFSKKTNAFSFQLFNFQTHSECQNI